LVKRTINEIPAVTRATPDAKDPLERAAAAGIQADRDLQQAITISVTPVKHTIKVEPVK